MEIEVLFDRKKFSYQIDNLQKVAIVDGEVGAKAPLISIFW